MNTKYWRDWAVLFDNGACLLTHQPADSEAISAYRAAEHAAWKMFAVGPEALTITFERKCLVPGPAKPVLRCACRLHAGAKAHLLVVPSPCMTHTAACLPQSQEIIRLACFPPLPTDDDHA